MVIFDNRSIAAWVYLALHGTYGFCWLLKHIAFPDQSWETKSTIGGAIIVFLLLATYLVAPYLLISNALGVDSTATPSWLLALCISLHTFGVVIMMVSDGQKYFTLKYRPGLITEGMFKRVRHPNYAGERKPWMIKHKLLLTTRILTLWGLIIITTTLIGCEPGAGQQIGQILKDTLPQIYDVEVPTEPYRTSTIYPSSFPLSATFEDNIWAGKNTARTLVVFRLLEDEDQCGATENERIIFQGNRACARVIDVRNNDCEQIPDSDAERCTANVTSQTGVYYFQWLIECFDCDGGDFIAEPDPPQETFKFEVYGALIDDDNDVEDPPPPPVDDSPFLELRDPENGSICTGNYVGGPDNTGLTTVTFRWHETGGINGTSLEGDFQILIEPAGSNGCSQAQNDNLVNIDEPNGVIERPDQCIITFININETARNLLPGTDYQWQVRRILNEDSAEFGPFTRPFVFTTAGYVTETPTFIDPNGNDSTNYPTQNEPPMTLNPATAISAFIQTRWTPVGCNPHSYTIELFRDGELNPSFTVSGACFADVQTDDRICEAEILVYAGSSYWLALNQQTQFGNINALLEFSVAGQP